MTEKNEKGKMRKGIKEETKKKGRDEKEMKRQKIKEKTKRKEKTN